MREGQKKEREGGKKEDEEEEFDPSVPPAL